VRLPEDDERYLNEKRYAWRLVPDPTTNGASLVISQYPLHPGKFDRERTDLMIRIPPSYNDAKLDMFYVDPPLVLRRTGGHPGAASVFEDILGRRWQRFSRHLPGGNWRAGVDGIASFLKLVNRDLQEPE
jgi:hypothetical protein